MCSLDGGNCRVSWAATPGMDLLYVQMIMNKLGMNEVPVVTEQFEDNRGHLVGLLDRECISLTRRLVLVVFLSYNTELNNAHTTMQLLIKLSK